MKRILAWAIIALLCLSLFSFIPLQTRASDLVIASYNFDEGSGNIAHDSSGYDNDGIISGAVEWVDGVEGSALRFRDTNTFVTMARSPDGLEGNHEFTVSLWVKAITWPTADQQYSYLILFGAPGVDGRSFHVLLCNDAPYSPYGTVRPGFWGARFAHTTHTFSTGVWYNWAFVYDKTEVKMYQNGTFLEDVTLDYAVPDIDSGGMMFLSAIAGVQCFDGILDEITIYNYARSAEEIQNDYIRYLSIVVPDDYPTIQEAINHASEGDSIFVRDGVYYENVIVNKTVSLLGESLNAIIDGNLAGESIICISADNVNVTWFTVRNSGSWSDASVELEHVVNCTIEANDLTTDNNLHQVALINSSGNSIRGNDIGYAHGSGVHLESSYRNKITGNSLVDCCTGINLRSSSRWNRIIGNTIIGYNFDGVHLYDSSNNNIISGNDIGPSREGCDGPGVLIHADSSNNSIIGNNIADNTMYGIGFMSSNYTVIYHNNFINNAGQVCFYSPSNATVWDNRYPSGGNYWSDYSGIDEKSGPNQDQSGSDDIGDTPYIINADNRDNYPLMNPWTPTPDFDVSISPDEQIGQPDSSVYYQIKITSENGFSSSVALTTEFSPNPLHMGWTLEPTEVTPTPNGQATASLKVNIYDDTPLKTYTITITATCGDLSKSADTKLSAEKGLEVPYQSQGYSDWCGPTSLAMVLSYYGESYHSWDYAFENNLDTHQGVGDLYLVLGDYVMRRFPSLDVEGGWWGLLMKDQIFGYVKAQINDGYPVIMALSSIPQGGHDIVIAGYNETGLFINDPSGFLFTVLLQSSRTSYNHAYVEWTQIDDFIVTWPFASTLTIKGTPNPSSRFGTLYTTVENDVEFYNPNDNSPKKDGYQLYLNGGLRWNHASKSELDNKINTKFSSLYVHIVASNCKATTQNFKVSLHILGPSGFDYELVTKDASILGFSDSARGTSTVWTITNLDTVLGKGGPYYLDIRLFDSGLSQIDRILSESFYWGGMKVQNKDNQHRLYLHVYDPQGRHVGVNYNTNETELNIPGAYYDDNNGTTTIILPEVISITVVVDAKYAEEPTELYNLTISVDSDFENYTQTYYGNITMGEKQALSTPTLTPINWGTAIIDTRWQTALMVSSDNKYFWFTAPDKDFGIIYDPDIIVSTNLAVAFRRDMIVRFEGIVIHYSNSTLNLTAIIGNDIDFSWSLAHDNLTNIDYRLVSMPNKAGIMR